MIVVSMTKCPPKLRGDLSKWLLEINTGVYVGQVSARVRDALWKRICDNIGDGQATMVFSTNNEQHMDFYIHNTTWKPIDLDGIKLMKRPLAVSYSDEPKLQSGFSNAAKRRMAQKRRRFAPPDTYMVMAFDTAENSSGESYISTIAVHSYTANSFTEKFEFSIGENQSCNKEYIKRQLKSLLEFVGLKTVYICSDDDSVDICEDFFAKNEYDLSELKYRDLCFVAERKLKNLDCISYDILVNHFGIVSVDNSISGKCKIINEIYFKLNNL
ncbi:MAG: type I-E CRISPR-associated endoribonuclease Cas2 [Ruminococcus sp.]|nr:type I-E CRISPR-associated endoribonuclease Cas2 [Ruminococcus sp.]